MRNTYDYHNVMLVPRECVLDSRKDADVSAKLGKMTFRIPLMVSNMPAIINEELAVNLAKRNYFYVMHRFNLNTLAFVKSMKDQGLFASISIGVKPEAFETLSQLKANGYTPEYVTIDVAHGHTKRIKPVIDHIRGLFGNDTFVIAGSVATPEGVRDLDSWGADAIRVGVGPGHVCSTSPKTGFGTRGWQLMAVEQCAKATNKVIIADGGVSETGDIAKAIHMGAQWVMSGYLYTGTVESPGPSVTKGDKQYKMYYGNASAHAKMSRHRVEGKDTLVAVTGSLYDRLEEVEEDLQSSVSYAGGTKLEDLRNVEHVFVDFNPKYLAV